MKITHFATSADFRRWLERNHASAAELQVGFYKKASGRGGMTYAEAVDEALCFGWIDGIVRKIGADSFTHRFTPRRPGSIWSNVNVGHVTRLTKAGRMHPAGVTAFEARTAGKTGIYTYEQGKQKLAPGRFPAALEKVFRTDKKAWAHWQRLAPSYQGKVIGWVASAKQDATRDNRLARVIAFCAAGKRLDGK